MLIISILSIVRDIFKPDGHIASMRIEDKCGGCHLHDDNHHETSNYMWVLLMRSRMFHTANTSDMTSFRESMSNINIDYPSTPRKSRGTAIRLKSIIAKILKQVNNFMAHWNLSIVVDNFKGIALKEFQLIEYKGAIYRV
jgi:hypothetical protein